MGADLILCAIDLPATCDWAAAERYLATFDPAQLDDEDCAFLLLAGEDTLDAEGLTALREQLAHDLQELRRIAGGAFPRDCVDIRVRGGTVLVAGGTSWGDSPSETYDAFERLCACGVLGPLAG